MVYFLYKYGYMNQDLMIRLFRSIEGESKDDLVKVAKKIIDNEEAKGHTKLAGRLKSILKSNTAESQSFKKELRTILPPGALIPTSRRHNIPLATCIDRNNLRHEMILPQEVEANFKRIESEYVARERLAHFGLKPRQKILFYGSPGCGKSMGAERIAWNIGLPFLKVRFEAIMSSYLGESASNLKSLFETAKQTPCVLLLDEFDFIAKARSTGHDVGEMHRMVNILLNLLEDYEAPGLLIATTNLEGALDQALFRRFDDIIEIPKPGKEEIQRLLKASLSSMVTDPKIDYTTLAEKMEGLSAAIVVQIAKNAAKMAVIKGAKKVGPAHLYEALEETHKHGK